MAVYSIYIVRILGGLDFAWAIIYLYFNPE